MLRIFRLVISLSLLGAFLGVLPASAKQPAPPAPWQAKVDPWVLATAQSGKTEFLVYLQQQADLSGASQLHTRLEKGRYVYERLRRTAAESQGPLLAALASAGVEYRPFWIANMVWVRGDQQVVQALAQRPEVAHLFANPNVRLDLPPDQPAAYAAEAPENIEWNLQKVGAPAVWAAGYTGQGVVIGGQDTGYQWDHPALIRQYRGWDGASADHNYNWFDAITSGGGDCGPKSPAPCDDYTPSHGTHTMGIMVGDDGQGNQVGMAPGARWIGCRNMDVGVGSPETYSTCFQWFLAPTDLNGNNPKPELAPDVINNSWGCPPSEGCTDPEVLQAVVNAVRAAGIVTVQSAGNYGPGCSTIDEPAAIYDASFTVGNTDLYDQIAGNSSRGPVTIDGSGRLKPDISAPGTNIRSSLRGDTYGILSGTSMAAPHVAGLVALLLSARPDLSGNVDAIENLIEQSAVHLTSTQTCGGIPGSSVPSNIFGWGRIDAPAAISSAPLQLAISKTASPSPVAPGTPLTYTLQVSNRHPISPTHQVLVSDVLPIQTTFLSATQPYTMTGNAITWEIPSLPANQSLSLKLMVKVGDSASGEIVNDQYQVSSTEVLTPVIGSPVTTTVGIQAGVALSSGGNFSAMPGQDFILTHVLTNTGNFTDTFDLNLDSSLGWTTLETPTPLPLAAGQASVIQLKIHLPQQVAGAATDVIALSARSQADPSKQASATDRVALIRKLFFPLAFR